jgi:hypothetical protein
MIGAVDRDSSKGAVYVFTYNGDEWGEQQILTASDAAEGDFFGATVAIDGDTAVIGAPFKESGAGYVFVFDGTIWVEQQKLTPGDNPENAFMGYSGAAISGDRIILGAPHTDIDAGAAYVFARSGTIWTQQQKLTGEGGWGTDFGAGVALDGDMALVGEVYTNGEIPAGLVYAFQWNGTTWERIQKFSSSGEDNTGNGDQFGWSIDLEDSIAVIGAPQSYSARIFVWDGTSWSLRTTLTGGSFGIGDSVALSGNYALVGAPDEQEGAAYIFEDVDDASGDELLVNGGFEADTNGDKNPDGWTAKNSTSDKRKCDKPGKIIAYEGSCVYQFKSAPGEAGKLIQIVDFSAAGLSAGDKITLSGFHDAKGTVDAKVNVRVTYTDTQLDMGKISLKLTALTPTYTPLTGDLTLAGSPATIKVMLQNKGTAGKVRFDAFSLAWTTTETFSRSLALP